MKDRLRLTDFMSIFLAFLIITLIAAGAFLGYVFHDEIKRGRLRQESEAQACVQRVGDYLDGLIRDEILLGESAASANWAIKLNSNSDVFDSEFTFYWQKNVQDNFLFRPVGLDNTVARRGMIFRQRDLAVSRTHWGDAEFFVGTLGVPRTLRGQTLLRIYACTLPTQIECVDEQGQNYLGRSLLFITPLKSTAHTEPQVFLCTLLNASNILKNVQAMLPSGAVHFSLVNRESGCVLLESGALRDTGGVQIEREILNTPWTAVFKVSTAEMYISQQALIRYLMIFAAMMLVGVLLSWALARWTYRPLRQLLRKVTGNPDDNNAYTTLNHSIDAMLERRREDQQAAAVRQLLMGYFEAGERVEELVSFRDDMYFRVMILSNGERRPVSGSFLQGARATLRSEEGVSWQTSEMLDGGLALILGAQTREQVHAASNRLQSLLEEEYWEVSLFFGSIAEGLVGISVSYQEARGKQFYLHRTQAHYYFPFDWESQLLGAIRQGRMNVAEEIIANLRQENEKALLAGRMQREGILQLFNHLLSDLQRCVCESGLDEELLAPLAELSTSGSFAEMWEILLQGVRRLDEALREQRGRVSTLDQRIVEYIQQHFDQPDLSITTLQEAFGISSATTINKSIRKLTGQTFQACLIKCRLDRAKELMQDRSLKISTIARQVGYENEYSFRRSFQRYTGCKVQDYQQSLTEES